MGLAKAINKTTNRISDWVKAKSVPLMGDVLRVDLTLLSPPKKSRLCLLAHYSKDGGISNCLMVYVKSLIDADCDVVLVSTAPNLDSCNVGELNRLGVGIILRRNVGYDFGSWCTAIRVLSGAEQQYRTVIFANDSVYGPFCDIRTIVEEMEARGIDVWSMTSSKEFHPHLQSYFWAVSNNGLHGDYFRFFWREYYRYYSDRRRVIDFFELEFSRIASDRFGLKVGAYVEIEKFDFLLRGKIKISKCNPTHHFALELLEDFGFPFVKRDLFMSGEYMEVYSALKECLFQKNPRLWNDVEWDLEKQRANLA